MATNRLTLGCRKTPSLVISTALGLRPRAVLITTSGIYFLQPRVNLYLCMLCVSNCTVYNYSIQLQPHVYTHFLGVTAIIKAIKPRIKELFYRIFKNSSSFLAVSSCWNLFLRICTTQLPKSTSELMLHFLSSSVLTSGVWLKEYRPIAFVWWWALRPSSA